MGRNIGFLWHIIQHIDISDFFDRIYQHLNNMADLRDRAQSFEAFGAYWDHNAIVTIDRDPERFDGRQG